MNVGQLIAYLQEYCKPEDAVTIVSSYYNGSEDIYDTYNPTIIVGYDYVILSPDKVYNVREAQSYSGVFCTIHSDGRIT